MAIHLAYGRHLAYLGLVACGMRDGACGTLYRCQSKLGKCVGCRCCCSFSFYWQRVACGMWQLHRLEVDAVPPTSYECGHITWKWAKSHTDQASTTDTHTCAQRKRCRDVKSCDCDGDCVCVAGHANSRVFVGQHFRLRSGGGFNAIWGLWSWPPPNQTSFKCAVVTARLHLLLLFPVFYSLSALSAAANEFLRSVGDVRCAYRYICIFADSSALAYSILLQQNITQMQNTQL